VTDAAKPRRWPLYVALFGVGGTLAAGWTALATGHAGFLEAPLERRASAALGRRVSIGGGLRIVLTPGSVRFAAERVTVANPRWAAQPQFLTARHAEARLSLVDLLTGRPALRELVLRDGTIALERERDGRRDTWSFARSGGLGAPERLAMDRMALAWRDPARGGEARIAIDGGAGTDRPLRFAGPARFGGETFAVHGTLAPVSGTGTVRLVAHARAQGMAITLDGTARGPFAFRPEDFAVTARGDDLARLLRPAGIVTGELPAFRLATRPARGRGGWHLLGLHGTIGATDIAGSVILARGPGGRMRLGGRLESKVLDLADAARLFALRLPGVPPAAAPAAAGNGAPAPARFAFLPDASLSPAALRGFDLDLDYSAARLAGTRTPVSRLSAKVSLRRGLLRFAPLNIDVAGGTLLSDIAVDARRTPALAQIDLRLQPVPMARCCRTGAWPGRARPPWSRAGSSSPGAVRRCRRRSAGPMGASRSSSRAARCVRCRPAPPRSTWPISARRSSAARPRRRKSIAASSPSTWPAEWRRLPRCS
jgi:hypothetical protein